MTLYSMTFYHSMTVSFVLYIFEQRLKAFPASFEEIDLVMERWEWHRIAIYTLRSTISASCALSLIVSGGRAAHQIKHLCVADGWSCGELFSITTFHRLPTVGHDFYLLKTAPLIPPSFSPSHSWQMSADLRVQCCRSLALLRNTSSQPHRHCWTSLDQNVTLCKTDSSRQTFGLDKRHSMHADIECLSACITLPHRCFIHLFNLVWCFTSLIEMGIPALFSNPHCLPQLAKISRLSQLPNLAPFGPVTSIYALCTYITSTLQCN